MKKQTKIDVFHVITEKQIRDCIARLKKLAPDEVEPRLIPAKIKELEKKLKSLKQNENKAKQKSRV
jgi:hypothetical protein